MRVYVCEPNRGGSSLVTFFEADKRRTKTRSRLIDVDVDEKKGRSDQINEMKKMYSISIDGGLVSLFIKRQSSKLYCFSLITLTMSLSVLL